jgi:anti-anti-sigma factor
MSIETAVNDNKLTIRITGRFDFGLHKDFRNASDKINANIRQVMVDLGRTEYVDSSALGMLLVLREKMGGDRAAVKITNASMEVKKVLEIANFNQLFTLA